MPSNTTPSTATAITSLPYSISEDPTGGSDSSFTTTCGSFFHAPLWWSYIPPAGVTCIGIGFQPHVTGTDYLPSLSVWTGTLPSSLTQTTFCCWLWNESNGESLVQLNVEPGTTYYFQVVQDNDPVGTLTNLDFRVVAGASETVPDGSLFISNDTAGFPSTIISATDGTILQSIGFPAFEQSAVLPDGSFLIAAVDTNYNTTSYKLYNAARELQTTITSIIVANQYEFGGVATDGTQFYVSAGVFSGGGSNGATLHRIDADGTVGTNWSLPAPAGNMTALAVSGNTVYWNRESSGNSAISRYDLGGGGALSDLVATEASVRRGRDLELTDDGDLLALRYDGNTDIYTIQRIDTGSGSIVQTYTPSDSVSGASTPRFRIDPNDPTHLWVMTFPSTTTQTFERILLSDGSVSTTFTIPFRQDDVDQQSPMFAASQSCPLLVTTGSTTPPDDPPDTPPTTTTTDDCVCGPPDGGGSGSYTPTGSGMFGGGGSGKSGTNEGGTGWTPHALCDGGGTVSSYATASAGESMAGVTDERVWVEVAFVEFADDDTETAAPEYWAINQTMPDPPASYGGRKGGRLFGISRITRSMSDDNGNYIGSKVTVKLNDKDRAALRTRLGNNNTKYVWEREGIGRIASEANRRAAYSTAPRELFRGVSHDVTLEAGFTGTISFEDKLCSQFGQFGPDRSFSSRLLSLGLLPSCPRELVGKPQQWIFGEVSDEGATDPVTGAASSKGLVPIWLVGSDGSNDHYHLAAHEIGAVTLYGSDGGTPPKRVLMSEGSQYTVQLLNLVDSETGLTHRVTHILVPTGSTPTEDHKSGKLNMAANVCGVLGANGETITDLFKIYQYIFEHIVLPDQESLTGAYVGSPQWADGRYMVHSDSFAEAQTFSIARVGSDGYQGGFVLGGPGEGPVTLRELLRRMSNSGDCWFSWTAAGQLRCVLLDDTADVSSAPIIREPAGLRQMPTPSFAFDEVENPVLFSYDYDDDKRKFRVAQESVQNDHAITRMGRPRPSPSPIPMRCVRDPITARDVAQRRLLRRKYPPAYYPVVEPLAGLDRDPGDIIKITSQEGVGTGCDERPMWIRDTSYDPATRRVTHTCRDLTDILAGVGLAAGDSVPTYASASADEQAAYMFAADDNGFVNGGTVLAKGVR